MDSIILYLFEVSVSLALFYSIYWLFLKKETFFAVNRFFLISSILFSFVVPFINASFLKISAPIASRQLIERTYLLGQTSSTQAKTMGVFDILWIIYLIGAGLFLLRFLYKLLKLLMFIKKSPVQKINGVNVVFVEKDLAPSSFFNLIFVNKSNISGDDFNRIIAHEMIHIRQYHSLDLFVMELLTIFQWFNPFVWPYKESLKETHEYLADNAVIAQGCNAAKYQLLIFEQHVGVKLLEFANNFNHSQIKRRITMMTKRKSKRWAKFKVLLILPLLSFLVLTFADSNTTREPDKAKQKDADNALFTQVDAEDSTAAKDQKKAEDEKKKKELYKKWAQEEAKKIEMSIKKLKEKYKATDDPVMRKEIEKKIADLKKQMVQLKQGQKVQTTKRVRPVEAQKADVTKKEYKEAEKIHTKKMKLEEGQKIEAKKMKLEKGQKVVKGQMLDGELLELKKLEQEYKATKDSEKKKKIKKKMEELQKWKKMEEMKELEMIIFELEQKYKATDDPELKKKIKEKLTVLKKELKKKKN